MDRIIRRMHPKKCLIVLCIICFMFLLFNFLAFKRTEFYLIRIENDSSRGTFVSNDFWNVTDRPVLANGHIGFVPFGDSIYMNGLYNGYKGDSHRARIPNYANVQFEPCTRDANDSKTCSYEFDIYNGVFRTQVQLNDGLFDVEHIQYAHRYHETAVVNQIRLKRNKILMGNAKFQLRLIQPDITQSDDLSIKSSQIFETSNKSFTIVEASTKILEDPKYQQNFSTVSILYEEIPHTIELLSNQTEATFVWIMIVQQNSSNIEQIFYDMHENSSDLLETHTKEWQQFWTEKRISVVGNDVLSNAIDASIFAIASALPSLRTAQPRNRFFGLSPAGLGLNRNLEVYNGHAFWDTEIWMHPTILLLEPEWSKALLSYRHFMRKTAQDNAANTSYEGYRYPWESAYTGIDVTLAEYPEIVKYQQHITADIGHALRKHFFTTHDFEWFRSVGCDLAYGTAGFWASRVSLNPNTHLYDINGIMGPDEDHYNINNNAYTNVVAALNLHFGSFASCFCNKLDPVKYPFNSNWSSIAQHITLLYDRQLDYHPQYEGYNLSVKIKQADVTLLGYPLQFANIRASTRRNNLNFYANITRLNGPAMTWSMHAIGHLEADSIPLNEEMFERTFIPYIRLPYFVWNEYKNGVPNGASNFITGAGGFLQLIVCGFAGIRINSDSLSIRQSQLPPNTTKLTLNGISYMQALFKVQIAQQNVRVDIRKGRTDLLVYIDDVEQDQGQNLFEFMNNQTLKLTPKTKSYMESCDLPLDTVEEWNIN